MMERSRPTGGRERLAARAVALSRAVDPITFEVLRHRLWTINDEAAAVLRVVSGSPVATETHDYNTMLMDGQGHAFVAGTYMMSQAIGQDLMVQHILREYVESPGIGEDDVFLCSNPYVGAAHQNDVTCLAPIHWKGELVAWSGVTIHEIDVGGPVPGSQCCIGAKSIYEEAPVIPPLKLVEGGRLRKDIEEEYLNRSRTRDMNAMDLRAKLAALHTVKQRLQGLLDRYGAETVKAVMTGMVDYAEARLRARLRELPDGTWRHTAYVDYYDAGELGIYPIRLAVTKQGDRLIFDFRGSAKQAPAVVNCTRAGLLAGIMGAVIPYLCYDMPWSPAGVLRAIEVRSEPGTICHAAWPAGVCKATTAATPMVNTAACVCVAKMLAASEPHRQFLMAPWMSLAAVQEIFGVDQRGEPFGVTMLDPMAGGGGARTDRDGIDTGGIIRALSLSIANVETYEFRYPFLYLARRQEPDSGGAGRFRGGMGVGIVYTPHPVAAIPTVILHTLCNAVPGSVGLAGGYPACTNQFFVLRDSDLWDRFTSGELPVRLDELQGCLEVTAAIQATSLQRGDVYCLVSTAGGGYGDPLGRDPRRVLQDVTDGLVSRECALELYGVVIATDGLAVDETATAGRRAALREARRRAGAIPDGPTAAAPEPGAGRDARGPAAPAGPTRPINEYLRLIGTGEGAWIVCRCGRALCGAADNYKRHVLMARYPLSRSGPKAVTARGQELFELREYYCPGCLTQIEVEVALKTDDLLWDVQLTL